LRIQQILAFESDLLEYGDIFDGSVVIEKKTNEVAEASWAELEEVLAMGGAFESIDELKSRLVGSQADRVRRIETGDLQVVGVNCFTETADSPLAAQSGVGGDGEGEAGRSILKVDPAVEPEMRADVAAWRSQRDGRVVTEALGELRRAAEGTDNVMPATIALAHAGGTTGEWAGVLREVFGEYRAPTGVGGGVGHRGTELGGVLARSKALADHAGGPPKLLVAKPGLDGHSNGAEQIAVAARDAGFEVIYQGIRLSPAEIAAAARDEDVDVVGISILSGSHLELVPDVVDRLRAFGLDVPVVVGGIIPPEDAEILIGKGVARVYTPKDFEIGRMMDDLAELAEQHRAALTS
jgi:(2R)-ethylmalonyl-CoA mutase